MANIILTNECQRNCQYCFASKDKDRNEDFTVENFDKVINLLSTGPKLINLLGGEPTLHENFNLFLDKLLKDEFQVQVFTNGMLDEDKLNKLISVIDSNSINKDQLYFCVNINEEKYRSEDEDKLTRHFLKHMSSLAYPSFNIFEKEAKLDFLIDLVKEYDLDPLIKLGLGLPGGDKHLPLKDYREVGLKILEFSDKVKANDIGIIFDCGFPLCLFTLSEVSRLNSNPLNDLMFYCGTPLDIHPDMTATNCYPLAHLHKVSLDKFDKFEDLYHYFKYTFKCDVGLYEECTSCELFKKLCFSGCKGLYLKEKKEDNGQNIKKQTAGTWSRK